MPMGQLKILVVDEDQQRGGMLADVLRVSGYNVVRRVNASDYLPNLIADAEPDLVLIDIGSPSRDTLEQLSDVHRRTPKPIVMFARDDDEKTIEMAVRAGVSAYIVDGMSQDRIKPIIDVAVAHFRHYHSLKLELEKTRATLDDRRDIERAKGLLMRHRSCSEEEAYAMLRKTAMDRKVRLGVVAAEIVEAAARLERAMAKPASGADHAPGATDQHGDSHAALERHAVKDQR